jgi:hypothetical protein
MKIMVRTVKWFQISRIQNAFRDLWRCWENNSSQNELLNIVPEIGPSESARRNGSLIVIDKP